MSANHQHSGPWFVHLNGGSIGPLPLDELRSLVQRSIVNTETMVSADGQTWQRAAHAIPSLFAGQTTGAASGTKPDYFKPGEKWYANTFEGKQYGPVSHTELVSWIVSMTLTPSCLVRRESDPQWHRVADVFGGAVPTQQPVIVASSPRPSPQPQPYVTPLRSQPSPYRKPAKASKPSGWETFGIICAVGIAGWMLFYLIGALKFDGLKTIGRIGQIGFIGLSILGGLKYLLSSGKR